MRASARGRLQPMKLGETARMNSSSLYRLVFRLQAETTSRAISERCGECGGERAERRARERRSGGRERRSGTPEPRPQLEELRFGRVGDEAARVPRSAARVPAAPPAPRRASSRRNCVFFLQWVKTDPTVKQVLLHKRNFFVRNRDANEASQERCGR